MEFGDASIRRKNENRISPLDFSDGLSQQIFSIPLTPGKYLIYAPLKGMAFLGNSALVNVLVEACQDPSGALQAADKFKLLDQFHFFQPEPVPADDYQDKGVQYDSVVLFLTNRCNLQCSYCYASSGESPARAMSWEIAKAAIDHVWRGVMEHRLPEMTLGFHGGGEPTLNWKVLIRSVDYARSLAEKNQVRLNVSGAFNGYWSKKVLDYIVLNFTDLSLSFDGLPAVQNAQRPAKGKTNSFTRVAATLKALDQARVSYGIRMTVTNEAVTRMAESVSYICDHFRPRKIQVEPAFEEGRALRNHSAIKNLRMFIDQFVKSYKIAEQHRIPLFYSGARLEVLNTRFCLAAYRALIVTPDGDITTCFETYGREHPLSRQFFVGRYQGGGKFLIEEEKLRRHFARTIQRIPYCERCFCKWQCAGDCAIKTVGRKNGGQFRPSARCLANQEISKFLILEKIRAGGGLFWVGQNTAEISKEGNA